MTMLSIIAKYRPLAKVVIGLRIRLIKCFATSRHLTRSIICMQARSSAFKMVRHIKHLYIFRGSTMMR